MSDTILALHTLGPLLLRDGRPFAGGDEESRAQSLPLPLPSTLAGFVRTQVGEAMGESWRGPDDILKQRLQNLHGIPVRSLLMRGDQFMLPAPQNALIDKAGKVYRLSPEALPAGEDGQEGPGTNLPNPQEHPAGLHPLSMSPAPDSSFKADSGYTYWPAEALRTWLLGQVPEKIEKIGGPPAEERTHVAMDSEKGVGDDGKLYSVTYRSFEERTEAGQHHTWSLRVKTKLDSLPARVGHLGGERRPAVLEALGNGPEHWWNIGKDEELERALLNPDNRRLCFILTSPALFDGGWKPGWLDMSAEQAEQHSGDTLPAGVKALAGRVRLVGAATGRRIPVSGWNLWTGTPKAVRWAVPAGSVYFLEVATEFDRHKLLDIWLRPLSDRQDDQRDGFGCAVWGVW